MDKARASKILAHLGTWNVHSPGVEDVLEAVEIQRRHRLSFWDAMILRSALSLSCGTLWTEDLDDGAAIGSVLVRNPFRD
jgi:predicted nucleic acid-binding protein